MVKFGEFVIKVLSKIISLNEVSSRLLGVGKRGEEMSFKIILVWKVY